MRVTDGAIEYEALPVAPALILLRGGRLRPRLLPAASLWERVRPCAERRRGERRRTRLTEAGRRHADHTSLVADLEMAELSRKLEERRQFVRDQR